MPARGGPGLPPAEARAGVEELRRRGLLLSQTRFQEQLGHQAGPGPGPSPITTAAWCTRDRPDLLARSLESYGRSFIRHDKRPLMMVIDDSDRGGPADANRSALETLSSEVFSGALPCRYVGGAQVRAS